MLLFRILSPLDSVSNQNYCTLPCNAEANITFPTVVPMLAPVDVFAAVASVALAGATYARRMNNERILRDGDAFERHRGLCHPSWGTAGMSNRGS